MNVRFIYWVVCLLGLPFQFLCAQPYQASRPSPMDQLNQAIQQLRTKVADLRHEMNNHESEIRTLEEKFQTQDSSLEQLREQLTTTLDQQKSQIQGVTSASDQKLEILNQTQRNLETLVRGVFSDMQQLRTQANESVTALGQYKQKINEMEQLMTLQNQHIQNLEAALRSIVDALQLKDPVKEVAAKNNTVHKNTADSKIYKVQSGDSLEKIAKRYNVSVPALREYNQLTNDRIVVGQIIKIP